jgi:hypothetical protein
MGGSSNSGGSSSAFVKMYQTFTAKLSGGSSRSSDSNPQVTHRRLITPSYSSDSDHERVYPNSYTVGSPSSVNNFIVPSGINHNPPVPPIFLVTNKHPFLITIFQTQPKCDGFLWTRCKIGSNANFIQNRESILFLDLKLTLRNVYPPFPALPRSGSFSTGVLKIFDLERQHYSIASRELRPIAEIAVGFILN